MVDDGECGDSEPASKSSNRARAAENRRGQPVIGRISFRPEVSVGNLLSVAAMLVMTTIFITSIKSTSQQEMGELRGDMKLYSSRLDQLQKDFTDFKAASQMSNTEVRQTLGTVNSAVADLRVLIAGQSKSNR